MVLFTIIFMFTWTLDSREHDLIMPPIIASYNKSNIASDLILICRYLLAVLMVDSHRERKTVVVGVPAIYLITYVM